MPRAGTEGQTFSVRPERPVLSRAFVSLMFGGGLTLLAMGTLTKPARLQGSPALTARSLPSYVRSDEPDYGVVDASDTDETVAPKPDQKNAQPAAATPSGPRVFSIQDLMKNLGNRSAR
jgi:hypothetical protein